MSSRETRPLAQPAVILLYHRVAELAQDPWGLALPPARFREHLEVLRQNFRVVALETLAEMVRAGRVTPGTIAVTFDDGYADNLEAAKPLLEQYEVPATVFIATGAHRPASGEFWWDELEGLLLTAGTLPQVVELRLGGLPPRWPLGEAAVYPSKTAQAHRAWRVGRPPPSARHALYLALWERFRSMGGLARRQALDELCAQIGTAPQARRSHRVLEATEIAALASGGLVAIGAHTVSHSRLADLTSDDQCDEIRRSKSELELILGRPVPSFAYPFGRVGDYTAETARLVREAGFGHACVNVSGTVDRACDLLRLPRLYVRDWDHGRFGATLAQQLSTVA